MLYVWNLWSSSGVGIWNFMKYVWNWILPNLPCFSILLILPALPPDVREAFEPVNGPPPPSSTTVITLTGPEDTHLDLGAPLRPSHAQPGFGRPRGRGTFFFDVRVSRFSFCCMFFKKKSASFRRVGISLTVDPLICFIWLQCNRIREEISDHFGDATYSGQGQMRVP